MTDQNDLFGEGGVDGRAEWTGMPEYDNADLNVPAISVRFNFPSLADYEHFCAVVSRELYGGARLFDGRQEKASKTTWYPRIPRGSDFVYADES